MFVAKVVFGVGFGAYKGALGRRFSDDFTDKNGGSAKVMWGSSQLVQFGDNFQEHDTGG